LAVVNYFEREQCPDGEPAKTTLLLKLAGELLARAETTDTERTPVIFALSTWSAQQPPIADWLVAEEIEPARGTIFRVYGGPQNARAYADFERFSEMAPAKRLDGGAKRI
jgi:hypothetical protein